MSLKYEDHVVIDPQLFRPEVLLANPTKAREKLGWSATTTLEELVAMMVDADVRRVERE